MKQISAKRIERLDKLYAVHEGDKQIGQARWLAAGFILLLAAGVASDQCAPFWLVVMLHAAALGALWLAGKECDE